MTVSFWLLIFAQDLHLPTPSPPVLTQWADLDGDGRPEVWTKCSDGWIWLASGKPEGTFSRLAHGGDLPPGIPVRKAEGWAYRTMLPGMWIEVTGEQSCSFPLLDVELRPHDEPKAGAWGWLVPTARGATVIQEDCSIEFSTPPRLSFAKRSMKLAWPEWSRQDVNGDGQGDWLASPLLREETGEISLFLALGQGTGWRPKGSQCQAPPGYRVVNFACGNLNGDAHPDFVLLLAPSSNMGLFDELELTYYLGDENGWLPHPPQRIRTEQNLWQSGPLRLTGASVELYYFKGLVRSHFRLDTYFWRDEILQPDPATIGWAVPNADRELLLIDWDFTGDGLGDLLLKQEEGMVIYPRQTGSKPFRSDKSISLERLGEGSSENHLEISNMPRLRPGRMEYQRLRGRKNVAVLGDQGKAEAFAWWQDALGSWILRTEKSRQ
jgi:hypothetical protein